MKISVQAIKDLAAGLWLEIICSLAPHLLYMIEHDRGHGPCPNCGGRDRARCYSDFETTGSIFCNNLVNGTDGFGALMDGNDWTFPEALGAVKSYLGLDNGQVPILARKWDGQRHRMQAVWGKAAQDTGRIAEYFKHCGISIPVPNTLRLHPRLYRYEVGSTDSYPAMLAEIIRDGQRVGLHQTWLDRNGSGKAPCSQPHKAWKCCESMTGGSIQLYPVEGDKPLALTEGLETALAVRELTGYPVWSCVNPRMLATVRLPESIKSVIICADKYKSNAGEIVAEKLAQRLIDEGRKVEISLPPLEIPDGAKSVYWSDYLNSKEVAHV